MHDTKAVPGGTMQPLVPQMISSSFTPRKCLIIGCIMCILSAIIGWHSGVLTWPEISSDADYPEPDDLMNYFVRVQGGRFVVGPKCKLMYVSGWNQWETVEAAAGVLRLYGASLPPKTSGQQLIRSQLATAAANGFNVIRAWANPVSLEYALMEGPGKYNEMVFRGLDYFLNEARKHNIRVILNLIDNWQEAGGVPQIQTLSGIDSHEDFFLESEAWKMYANHVKTILLRKNSVNGIMYKDDPTIFSWELINEPRCGGCPSMVLQSWISSMAEFVKSIDPNHLLTVGEEGFFSNEDSHKVSYANPSGTGSWAGDQGQNFAADHSDSNIDYAGIHMWIQNWEDATDDFAFRWLDEHIRQSRRLGKPLIMSEFGAWGSSLSLQKSRDEWYRKIYNHLLEDAKRGGACAGGLFWQYFEKGQYAPLEESRLPGGIFGVFENDTSFEIAKNFTREMQSINNEYEFDGICEASTRAPPTQECTKTRVRHIPGTGYEGPQCDININECARGVDDCDSNAECVDTDGSFNCVCHAGFSGNGHTCKADEKQIENIQESFKSNGEGSLVCNKGKDILFKPGYPGYMYNGLVNQSMQPVLYDSSTRAVEPRECMIACRMAHRCNAFTYDSYQKKCFLHELDTSSVDICPQPPSYCVAIRGSPYQCSQLETYFDTTKIPENALLHQKTQRRKVRDVVLASYYSA
jgi:mannan endo-1,4-beta-mannosidase